MPPTDPDKRLRELIAKAFVPPDLCAEDPADIEAMLDAAASAPFDEEQTEQILRKARGAIPVGEREEEQPTWEETDLTVEERELVALHRGEGGKLPPEIEEKLRLLREKAREEARKRDEDDGYVE